MGCPNLFILFAGICEVQRTETYVDPFDNDMRF